MSHILNQKTELKNELIARVLIADDEKLNRTILKKILSDSGHTVKEAENGLNALNILKSEAIDVLLLDLEMPELDGFSVLNTMQSDQVLSLVPVIIISSHNQMETVIQCMRLGAIDYLAKPVDPFLLLRRISSAISQKRLKEAKQQYTEDLERMNQELAVLHKKLNTITMNLDKRVRDRTEEVERLLVQKDAFIAQLGHDLKTPLTPILGLIPLLIKNAHTEKEKNLLSAVLKNAKILKELVLRTLELARLNSESVQILMRDVILSKSVSQVLIKYESLAKEKNIDFEIAIEPYLTVYANEVLLDEVFDNLISNSVKYMTPTGGLVKISAQESSGIVSIIVEDNGIGIEEKDLEHIFDEFYKADDSRHDRDSFGLGLSICKRILKRHEGEIWAESRGKGMGSKFIFSLNNSTHPR